MHGEFKARNAITMDTHKVKTLSKKYGGTVNDLMMSIGTVAFKRYFDLKNDKSELLTWLIPFSFKGIPSDPK